VKVAYARNYARGLLKDAQITNYPISVNKIAKLLNLSLWEYNQLPESIGALLSYKAKAIAVNPNHCDETKRFSIAHELGHYALGHCNALNPIRYDDFLAQCDLEMKYSGEQRSEASEFAAELLIPLDFVKEAMKTCTNPKKLANLFIVNEQTMWIRLSRLNLIKYL